MKTFGQRIREARKFAGVSQKEVAERLRRADGRRVLPPFLNDLEFDRRYPPEDTVIEQLAAILKIPADILYFYAEPLPQDLRHDADDECIMAACRAFRQTLNGPASPRAGGARADASKGRSWRGGVLAPPDDERSWDVPR